MDRDGLNEVIKRLIAGEDVPFAAFGRYGEDGAEQIGRAVSEAGLDLRTTHDHNWRAVPTNSP